MELLRASGSAAAISSNKAEDWSGMAAIIFAAENSYWPAAPEARHCSFGSAPQFYQHEKSHLQRQHPIACLIHA
jgi:hypothetical protein